MTYSDLSEGMTRVGWQRQQSVGRLKVATNMQDVKSVFNERFHKWGIHLPEEDLHQRKRGRIQKNGWSINYHFISSGGKEFIEYFSSHRMTNDTLTRIYEDGTTEVVGCCQVFYQADDPQAEKEYLEHNRNFYNRVDELGLRKR